MKKLGTLFFAVGIIAIFFSLNERATANDSDVYNYGLLNQRTNHVIVSCVIMLIGAIWMGKDNDLDSMLSRFIKPAPKVNEEATNEHHEETTQSDNNT